ncbi:zinc-binding dehydrogenase [Streptomyces spectabilis]|uniref:NADPH quinone oxidoreductase n=1 Tax=Streptomyces spectabilis TaxID=68270 RepID=A0A5P2X8S9_STRST|nr:zinc-binding dehydrogenase [Streptomyces spectabilis]MBB5108063.1 NADPH:quinone reductase-like Zn-dependent oxidoreductase [Streptomyces spectabilis]MCI3904289.1 zinc-binding dehydrogenase [Streptomyces spectabilis]QEV61403.1 NADPH quinone oxidoreductase [Streptomyces spectabilis]GGV26296.1 oxidoreductase [Streptomyces spectabilis]
MHAVVLREFGPAQNLRYETVPDPEPGPGQVRIAVRAAGVHFIETVMRAGAASDLAPPLPELPAIFGGEVAGVVDAVGPGVDGSWLGRSVVTGSGTPGGYAELAVAAVEQVHPLPDGLGFQDAVAMVVTGATAVGLLDIARLTADDVVLVTSAAGGVGRLVVQHALAVGATVVGAAGGAAKADAVRKLGAEAVDYREDGWDDAVRELLGGEQRPVTVVLDGVGGPLAAAAFELIGEGGRFVSIGYASQVAFTPPPGPVAYVDALRALLNRPQDRPGYEGRALAAGARGELVPAVQSFPLSHAAEVHAALERRETTGKVVLVP